MRPRSISTKAMTRLARPALLIAALCLGMLTACQQLAPQSPNLPYLAQTHGEGVARAA